MHHHHRITQRGSRKRYKTQTYLQRRAPERDGTRWPSAHRWNGRQTPSSAHQLDVSRDSWKVKVSPERAVRVTVKPSKNRLTSTPSAYPQHHYSTQHCRRARLNWWAHGFDPQQHCRRSRAGHPRSHAAATTDDGERSPADPAPQHICVLG